MDDFPKKESIEGREGIFAEEHWEYGGANIHVVAVTHIRRNYELNRGKIENAIQSADIVLSENTSIDPRLRSSTEEDWQDSYKIYVSFAQLEGVTPLTYDEFRKSEGPRFFELLTQDVARFNKTLAVTDPNMSFSYRELEKRDRDFQDSKDAAAALSLLLGVVTTLAVPGVTESLLKKPLSRRTFLKGALFAGGVGAATIMGLPAIAEKIESRRNDLTSNELNAFLMSAMDFRNVYIADGIAKLIEENGTEEGLDITLVYGASHWKPIKQYLDSPNIRKWKKSLYKQVFGDIVEPHLYMWEYKKDGEAENEWERTQEFVL